MLATALVSHPQRCDKHHDGTLLKWAGDSCALKKTLNPLLLSFEDAEGDAPRSGLLHNLTWCEEDPQCFLFSFRQVKQTHQSAQRLKLRKGCKQT